jgi:hypothetical protein
MVIVAIQLVWRTKTETAFKKARRVPRVFNYATIKKLLSDVPTNWAGKGHAQPDEAS